MRLNGTLARRVSLAFDARRLLSASGWLVIAEVMRFGAHLLTSICPKDGDVKIERVTLKGWIPDLAPVGDKSSAHARRLDRVQRLRMQ